MFQFDPGSPPGKLAPLENQVPGQEIDGRPLVHVREQKIMMSDNMPASGMDNMTKWTWKMC